MWALDAAATLHTRVKGMGVEEVVIAPRSPWQNPFVERVVGSIRRNVWTT